VTALEENIWRILFLSGKNNKVKYRFSPQEISSSRDVIFFLLYRRVFLHKQQCKSGK